jgi:hypothetical protein
MIPARFRLQAMFRCLLLGVVVLSGAAFAQYDDFSPPPLLSADQPNQPAPQPQNPQAPQNPSPQQPYPQNQYQPYPPQNQYQPYPGQQQQYPQQQYPQQQYPQQQYPQQQYPQQQYPQQQYPQQQYPQQQYPQQQYPQQQQPQYQQRPQPQQRQPAQEAQEQGFFTSTRTKHFVGLLTGALGVTNNSAGLVGNARVEFDISRFGFLLGYSNFYSLFSDIQIHQFNLMAGFAFFSSDQVTLRALAGVDIMSRNGITGTGPIFGANLRSMFGRVGVDAAFMFTVFPFRQLEGRAAFVVRWSIFEAHFGWRVQIIDATQSGTLGTLFTTAPGINGPMIGIGFTL